MTLSLSSTSFIAFVREVVQRATALQSFTCLTVQEFDNIFDNYIIKKYHKHEIKRLFNRKDDRKRKIDAGRY